MVQGDVGILDRIRKADRRADRASQRLIKKLARTKRNKRLAQHVTVESPPFHGLSFANALDPIFKQDVVAAKRRLAKARDENGHRAFYVDELCCGSDDESVGMLVVMARSALASPSHACIAVTKDTRSQMKQSRGRVCILKQTGSVPLEFAGTIGNCVTLRMIHADAIPTLLYASVHDSGDSSVRSQDQPRSLGLDRDTTDRLQSVVSRMLGARLV